MIKLNLSLFLVLTMAAAAYGQSMSKQNDPKQTSPGATGVMNNVGANGVAADPGAVQAQQQGAGKSSPGTVGAAPGADTPSQIPKR